MTEVFCIICHGKIQPDNFLCSHCGYDPINRNVLESMQEMSHLTVKLSNKINSLLQEYVINAKFDSSDERNQSLGALNTFTLWLNIQLMLYVLQKKDDPIPRKILQTNPTTSDKELWYIMNNLDLVNQRSFLTLFLAQVEVLLKRISELLPNPDYGIGYENLIKHILKELSLITPDNELFRILYFPAIIRNTLHTNGHYTKEKYVGKIDGVPFTFEKNKVIDYSSWRHMYFFCDKILDTLEIILKHSSIRNKSILTLNVDPLTHTFKPDKS